MMLMGSGPASAWKTKWQKMAASCKRVDHGKRKRKLLYSMKNGIMGKRMGPRYCHWAAVKDLKLRYENRDA